MKTKIFTIDGKRGKEISLPEAFSAQVREDIISKVVEAQKRKQPYAPSPVAGMQYSASGKLIHRRHVWQSQYGRGMSRVPRKRMMRRGSQFQWEGATSPNTKGGRRAHPPKITSMINTLKINKKEMRLALISALAATIIPQKLQEKYSSLKNIKIENLPLVSESKLATLKTKELRKALELILGKELYSVALKQKVQRAGKGSRRGRKYKSNAGILLVISDSEKLKTTICEVKNAKDINVSDLAKGGSGRLTMYTENAIEDLNKRLDKKEK